MNGIVYLLILLLLIMIVALGTIWYSRNWKFSMFVCFLIGIICSIVYFYSLTQRGIPSSVGFPERFLVLAVSVKEPNNISEGAIYFWVRPIPSDKDHTPLSFRIPYSKEKHEMVKQIQKRIRQNQYTLLEKKGLSGKNSKETNSGQIARWGGSPGSGEGQAKSGNLSSNFFDNMLSTLNNIFYTPKFDFELKELEFPFPKDGS